jgi:Tol biopolymer transport system component
VRAAAALAVAILVVLDAGPALAPAVAAPALGSRAVRIAAASASLETPGETDRVSFETDGSETTQRSGSAAISASGQYVVYREALPDATGVDLGRIMLRDRVAGTTTEVARGSVVVGLAVAVTAVSDPAISGDGRWVAFVAGNPDATANSRTIRLWDSQTSQITSPLGQVRGWADQPALSGDGRYLAFRTNASLTGSDANERADVYVLDRQSGGFDRVSTSTDGKGGLRGDSGEPAISSDGRWVAFSSNAILLVSAPVPSGQGQVYLRDRSLATTVLVSATPLGGGGAGSSGGPSIAADGSIVAFSSSAADLVPGDTNGFLDVFAWASRSHVVTRVSVSSSGAQANGASGLPSITGDGSQVAFASTASNLVPNDTNGAAGISARQGGLDIFVRNLGTKQTSRISVGPGPVEANGSSTAPSADADGAVIAFESDATNLVAGDQNQVRDVFVRIRPPGAALAPNPADFGTLSGGSKPPPPKTVTVTSTGVVPLAVSGVTIGGADAASFAILSDKCTGRQLAPGATCPIVVGVTATTAGQLAAQLLVADSAPGSPHAAALTALVLGVGAPPKISISPRVGPPGTVVAVTGSNFAAGQPVTLVWSAGITPQPLSAVVAGPDGTLHAQVLVLPHDILGKRTLTATSIVNGTPGVPATAAFLVVPDTAQPPTSPYVHILVVGMGRPLIWRR